MNANDPIRSKRVPRFVEEYCKDRNGTQAAIRAGYLAAKLGEKGFYVYFLIDPRTEEIFYVGKGCKNRVREHRKKVLRGDVDNAQKAARIEEIELSGRRCKEMVLCYCASEKDAYSVERQLIQALRPFGLTNALRGNSALSWREQQALSAAKALDFLARLKPYTLWEPTISDKVRAMIAALGETPESFYGKLKSSAVRRLND